MDVFSTSLPVDAFNKVPTEIARPAIDAATAERIVQVLATAERPVLYAGGGVLSARASAELAALATRLELPIAHSLMGKGVVREDHPLLLGMTGFWGTPIATKVPHRGRHPRGRDALRRSQLSSWDPRFTFDIPPTRLIHVDADVAEIGRFPTELGVVADASWRCRRWSMPPRGSSTQSRLLRLEIAQGRRVFAANWADHYSSNQYPMRPERILASCGGSPEDGYIVTDVGWNKNGVGSNFRSRCPARSSRRAACDDGLRAGGGAGRRWRSRTAPSWRLSATVRSAAIPPSSPPRWRPA
jgi:acetolactate synthase-1/2/3 large subunit